MKVCGRDGLKVYSLVMSAQTGRATKRLHLAGLTAEFRWSAQKLEEGEIPSGLPRIVRERVDELLSLGCRKEDALAQAQGERHIRISQRMRVIRHWGSFAFSDLSHAASEYPFETLEFEKEGLKQKCRLAYCAYLDYIEAKKTPRFISARTAAPAAH